MSTRRHTRPLPAETIAQRLEVVAAEYEARARFFRDRAAAVRAETDVKAAS